MLPFSLSCLINLSPFLELLLGLVSVDIVINSRVAVDVDIDIAPVPVAATPGVAPRRAHGHARCKGKRSGRSYVSGRIVGIRRISRVGPRAIHDRRVICWYVNDLRTSRFDLYNLLFDDYGLFFGRLEIPRRLCFSAQALDRIQDLFLILQKGIPHFLRPVELFAHHCEHLRKVHQRLYTRIPVLRFKCLG